MRELAERTRGERVHGGEQFVELLAGRGGLEDSAEASALNVEGEHRQRAFALWCQLHAVPEVEVAGICLVCDEQLAARSVIGVAVDEGP